MNPKASFGNIFRELAAGDYTLLMQDNSANKLQFTSFLKFEPHYPPLRGIVPLHAAG
jgi:hypothetical protein